MISPAGNFTITDGDLTSECISVVFHDSGDFFINIAASNPCGADDSLQIVTIFETPVAGATIALPDGNRCAPLEADFINNSVANTSSEWIIEPEFGWNFIDDSDEFSENPSLVFTQADTFIITLIAANGCGDSTWVDTVIINDDVGISFNPFEDVCEPTGFLPSATITDNGCLLYTSPSPRD